MVTRPRAVLPSAEHSEVETPLSEQEKQYAALWQQLWAVIDEKGELHRRIDQRDGSLGELAGQLRGLLAREAAICDQIAAFWAAEDDVCSAYVNWSWAKHLRQLDARRYVETLWLANFAEALDDSP